MEEALTRPEQLDKVNSLIRGIRVAMLTTECEDGRLRSRPMVTQDIEFDGVLWFFTKVHTAKVEEIDRHHEVNLSYMHPENNSYVSLSGTAELVRDHGKIEELWRPWHEAWFPHGQTDPELGLLRVEVHQAEYWDSPSGRMALLWSVARSMLSGNPMRSRDHKRLDM